VTELHGWHYDKLVRLALLVTGDLPTAEDAVQDAFVSLSLRWRRLRNADSAHSYLRKEVVNNALSVLRRRAVAARNTGVTVRRHEPSPERQALIRFESSALVATLHQLSVQQRVAVVLRYYGGLSEVEIAAAMGISESAVKANASRGIAALRASWRTAQAEAEGHTLI
jgi:RNA polymerase sigma factor (sigma-70 family)